MVHGLREFADLVDESERRGEILELPRSRDRVPLPRPLRNFFQSIRDVRLGEKGAPRHDDPRACNAATRKKGLETVGSTLFKVNTSRSSLHRSMASSHNHDRRLPHNVESPGDIEGDMEHIAVV